MTRKGGGASPPGRAGERVKALLFTRVGQNGSVVWRKRVASSERENPVWISSAERKRADCKDVTFPGEGWRCNISLEALAMGVTTRCGGGKKFLIREKKMSKALHISPSAHPGFGNGAGLRNLGGFRNASLLVAAAFI